MTAFDYIDKHPFFFAFWLFISIVGLCAVARSFSVRLIVSRDAEDDDSDVDGG